MIIPVSLKRLSRAQNTHEHMRPAQSQLIICIEHVKEPRVLVEVNERLWRHAGRHVLRPDAWP